MNELSIKEQCLIEIFRAFLFLEKEGYEIFNITYGGRELPSIIYKNKKTKIQVWIIGSEIDHHIVISRQKLLAFKKESYVFDISDYYKYFFCGMIKARHYTLFQQAKFIQTYLMKIIKGDLWITQLFPPLSRGCKK